jgi:outer membrane lipoprotein LolB
MVSPRNLPRQDSSGRKRPSRGSLDEHRATDGFPPLPAFLRFGPRLVVCLAVMLVAACAVAPLAPRDPQPFDLLGRVLVSYSGGALTANLRWEHGAQKDEIWLMTPTGQTLAHIVDSPAGAVLTRADQQRYEAANVETLTQQALGWALPLALLQHWVRGRAAPGPMSDVQKNGEQPVAFAQHGWRVAISYHTDGEYTGRVRRLDLTDGSNEIRFVVDTWRES